MDHPSVGAHICVHRFWAFVIFISVAQTKTVVIHTHGMVVAMSTNVVVKMQSKKLAFKRVRLIQCIPNGRIRVTFMSVEYRNAICE